MSRNCMEGFKHPFFNSKMLKEDERKYLFDTFMKVTKIISSYSEEEKILDFISEEISKVKFEKDRRLKIHRDNKIGVFVIIPSKSCPCCINDEDCFDEVKEEEESRQDCKCKCENTVMFVSHSDTVEDRFCDPQFFRVNIRTGEKTSVGREIVECSFIDDRVHVAVMLTMIRFCRYSDTKFICYFSVMEEQGMIGAKNFVENIDLEKEFKNVRLKEIVILDVESVSPLTVLKDERDLMGNETYEELQKLNRILGIEYHQDEENEDYQPKIGYGVIGLVQDYSCKSPGMTKTDGTQFFVEPYLGVRKVCYGVGCFQMHKVYSYCSTDDMFDLYDFLVFGYLKEMKKRLLEENFYL